MTDEVTPRFSAKKFHEQPGVEDWSVLFWGAYVHYVCDSLAHAVALVNAVAVIAERVGHSPDLDVRPEGVTIRTTTKRDGTLSLQDAALAREIQVVARELGYRSDPSTLLVTGIAVAQGADVDNRPFWAAVMGYEFLGDEDAVDPQRRNPHTWFHELTPPRPGRGRTHIDISVPAAFGEARVNAALAHGGRIVEKHASHWTIASPDNHKIDVAIWADSEDFA